MMYARVCDETGEDIVGGDNLLPLDGRFSFTRMRSRAAEFARSKGAPGYNIYRSLRDSKPLFQVIFI